MTVSVHALYSAGCCCPASAEQAAAVELNYCTGNCCAARHLVSYKLSCKLFHKLLPPNVPCWIGACNLLHGLLLPLQKLLPAAATLQAFALADAIIQKILLGTCCPARSLARNRAYSSPCPKSCFTSTCCPGTMLRATAALPGANMNRALLPAQIITLSYVTPRQAQLIALQQAQLTALDRHKLPAYMCSCM